MADNVVNFLLVSQNEYAFKFRYRMMPYKLILLLCVSMFTSAISLADEKAIALLKKVDELYRSQSAIATMEMTVVTPNWQRTMTLQSWSRGLDDTFIRILSPKKDRGVATLKLDQEMWNYFPKINKVIKVPPSMMMGSWMGSDFTNDDLVREVSLVEDYHVALSNQAASHLLTLIPKKETVTVWGKIEVEVKKDSLMPLEQRYFNEKGMLVRSMVFDKIKKFSGRLMPARLIMTPHNKQGNATTIEYLEMEFDQDLPKNIFSLRNLQKRFN